MINKFTPLTESTYLILISLTKSMHGYGIMQEIDNLSNGRVKMGPGTLYGGLSTLLEKKLIERVDNMESGSDNSRKKMYKITDQGLLILKNEYERLVQLVEIGGKKLSIDFDKGERNGK